jgi:hypothetical protein
LHQHVVHQFGRYRPGYGSFYSVPDCYDPYYLHANYPWPLSCS